MKSTVARHISGLLTAIDNCQERVDNPHNSDDDKALASSWITKHNQLIDSICREHMPSGSGFDNGTYLWREKSTPDRLVFGTAFHHMDDSGMYDEWTRHEVYVTPTFTGVKLRITGRDYRDIKDYIADCFYDSLDNEIDV